MQPHNVLAIVVAAVVAFLIGGLWYSPLLFAKQWMAAHAHTPEDVERMKADAPRAYGISFVAFLVMAFVLQLLINHLDAHTWQKGAAWAAHLWLGFAATIGLMANVYSGGKFPVFLIDAGYQLVYLLVMGAILGAWH
ncbi:MAG: DUF1761 domain-containing protein [Gemmatimonadota bacterium]